MEEYIVIILLLQPITFLCCNITPSDELGEAYFTFQQRGYLRWCYQISVVSSYCPIII